MDRDPGDQRRASLRASDADRERFVEPLRRHHADGRLTADELAERTERAYAAKWIHDLDALATDLPPLQPPAPPPRPAGPRRPRVCRPGCGPPAPSGPRPRPACPARSCGTGSSACS
jgi:Domain of unknown function (DUF1707)